MIYGYAESALTADLGDPKEKLLAAGANRVFAETRAA